MVCICIFLTGFALFWLVLSCVAYWNILILFYIMGIITFSGKGYKKKHQATLILASGWRFMVTLN